MRFSVGVGGLRARMSRRSFLKGTSAATAGLAALETAVTPAVAAEPQVFGPDAVSVALRVNGQSHTVAVEPRTTLAEVLRGPLNLTGTKVACDRGSCSACTVLLDGAPVASCSMLALDVGNRAITTIEGLASGETLHPVQAAFIEHDALQCGFCTPGMVLSSAALLERNPQPTAGDVKAAISGHVCRCGTYPHVVDAVLAAARTGRG
jgi:aerobic-type carbon monoxide dehydrogenase small subunit (CoxS/CutS family)